VSQNVQRCKPVPVAPNAHGEASGPRGNATEHPLQDAPVTAIALGAEPCHRTTVPVRPAGFGRQRRTTGDVSPLPAPWRPLGVSRGRRTSGGGIEYPRIYARDFHHFVAPLHYGRSMGRPRIYDEPRVATAIRLPASLRDELQAAATERDVSVNFLVTRAVLDYLRRLPAIDPVEPLGARAYRSRAAARATS
jgi:hypothetical protein